MALDQTQNFVRVDVSGGHNDTETTISLAAGEAAELPDPTNGEYNMTWWDTANYARADSDPNVEIVRVTAVDTGADTVTVTRGQENTTASTKNTGDGSYDLLLGPTSKMFDDINQRSKDVILVASGSSTDINAQNDVVWDNTDIIDSSAFSFDGTTVTVQEDGVYRIEANFDFTDTQARVSPNAFIRDSADNIIGVGGRTGYMRNADGHDTSSIHPRGVATLTSGDTFTIEGFQGSSLGAVIAPSRAQLYVRKLAR